MHDQVVDAAAGVVEPKRRKVRKLAVALHVANSVVELVAGRYVKAVNRIWGAKVGEYLSAPDGATPPLARMFRLRSPQLPMANSGSSNTLVRPPHIRTGQGAGCTSVW